jgi:predicted transcriptional regulator
MMMDLLLVSNLRGENKMTKVKRKRVKRVREELKLTQEQIKENVKIIMDFISLVNPTAAQGGKVKGTQEIAFFERRADRGTIVHKSSPLWIVDEKAEEYLIKRFEDNNGIPMCNFFSGFTYDRYKLKENGDHPDKVTIENSLYTQILPIDFDGITLEQFEEMKQKLLSLGIPTLDVFSGHGVQSFVLLTRKCYDKKIYEKFTNLLLKAGFPVDSQIKDSARLLRLPNTFNSKAFQVGLSKFFDPVDPKQIPTYVLNWTDERCELNDVFAALNKYIASLKLTDDPFEEEAEELDDSFFAPFEVIEKAQIKEDSVENYYESLYQEEYIPPFNDNFEDPFGPYEEPVYEEPPYEEPSAPILFEEEYPFDEFGGFLPIEKSTEIKEPEQVQNKTNEPAAKVESKKEKPIVKQDKVPSEKVTYTLNSEVPNSEIKTPAHFAKLYIHFDFLKLPGAFQRVLMGVPQGKGVGNASLLFLVRTFKKFFKLSYKETLDSMKTWAKLCTPIWTESEIESETLRLFKYDKEGKFGLYTPEMEAYFGKMSLEQYKIDRDKIAIPRNVFEKMHDITDGGFRLYLGIKLLEHMKKKKNFTELEILKTLKVSDRTFRTNIKCLTKNNIVTKKKTKSKKSGEGYEYYANPFEDEFKGFTLFSSSLIMLLLNYKFKGAEDKFYLYIMYMGDCFASQVYLANAIGKKDHTAISKLTTRLHDLGLIIKETSDDGRQCIYELRIT